MLPTCGSLLAPTAAQLKAQQSPTEIKSPKSPTFGAEIVSQLSPPQWRLEKTASLAAFLANPRETIKYSKISM
jgi:hypothetical protein